MPASVGKVFVDVEPNLDGFAVALNSKLDPVLGGLGGKFGKFGKVAAVGVAAVGTAAVVAGKQLYDIGGQFDDAYDQIRVATGKTGKSLEGLEKDFKQVVKGVPTDFGAASEAVSGLSTRLNITGKPLQNLSEQVLELSRLTKTDLGGNIESVTRVMGDWSVKTGDQGKALDRLFRASQATKVPVRELADSLVKYGAPLRALGFSMDESTALIGKFRKEGVNTDLVLASMRVSLSRMAKAGKDPQTEFARLTDAIKNSGSEAEAQKISYELFGARAGTDMARAIREGRFEIGDLQRTIAGGKDTIMGASKDTQDLGEKWQIFKNKILVGLEPVATGVFNAVGQAADLLGPALDDVSKAVRWIVDLFQRADGAGKGAAGTLGALQRAGQAFGQLWQATMDLARAAWDRFGDRITIVASTMIGFVRRWLDSVIATLTGVMQFITAVFQGDWSAAWDAIKAIAAGVWDGLKNMIGFVLDQIGNALALAWDAMKALAEVRWEAFKSVVSAIAGALRDKLAEIWTSVKTAASEAWESTKGAVVGKARELRDDARQAVDDLRDKIAGIWTSIKSKASEQWDNIKGEITGAARGVKSEVEKIWGGLKENVGKLWGEIVGGVKQFGDDVAEKVVGAFAGVVGKVENFVNSIIRVINKIPGVDIALVGGGSKKIAVRQQADVPGLAQGGTVPYSQFARGFNVKKPMVVIGEEGDRGHDEFVIPTNPAYRGRALDLYSQLGARLGVPGFFAGGILGKAVDFLSGGVSKAVSGITSRLPNPAAMLPDWIRPVGTTAISDVKTWIKAKIQGLWSDKPGKIAAMVDFMNGVHAKGYPYVYGGGHGGFGGPYDCSGLVSAVLHSAGLIGSPMTTDGLKNYGESGSGEMVTIGVRGSTGRNAHTMMRIGDRYLESGSGHGARWVSGWSGSFPIKRHPRGFAQGGIIDQMLRPDLVGWGLAQGGVLPYVGAYERGGIIPADGMAHVHKGELVTPADQVGRSVTLTGDVYISVAGGPFERVIDARLEVRDRETAQQLNAGVAR